MPCRPQKGWQGWKKWWTAARFGLLAEESLGDPANAGPGSLSRQRLASTEVVTAWWIERSSRRFCPIAGAVTSPPSTKSPRHTSGSRIGARIRYTSLDDRARLARETEAQAVTGVPPNQGSLFSRN